jgi:hypothetical protein
MTRFQLVFRHADGDWSENRENNVDGEPHINGELIVDGETYVIKDVEWIVRSDDIGDAMRRFMCTLVVDPTDGVIDLYEPR